MTIDAEGIITTFNKAAEKYTQRKREEAMGRYLADVVIPTGLLDIVQTGEKQFDYKIEAFHRIYVSNRSAIVEDGKVVGAVGVFQDISELEEVSRELRMLSQLNEELVTIIDSSYDGIIVTDNVGAIIRTNAAAGRLFQKRQEDLLKSFVDNLLELPSPTLWEEIISKRKAVTRELADRHMVITGNPVFREDGSLRRVQLMSKQLVMTIIK